MSEETALWERGEVDEGEKGPLGIPLAAQHPPHLTAAGLVADKAFTYVIYGERSKQIFKRLLAHARAHTRFKSKE